MVVFNEIHNQHLQTSVGIVSVLTEDNKRVYKNIKDFEGLQKFAKNIKEIGFESMQAIHPEQVEIINTAFKPTLDEINEAEELLRDIEYNDKKGIGVFVDSNGSIVDAAMVSKARKIANQSE